MSDEQPKLCRNCQKPATHFEWGETRDVYGHKATRMLHWCDRCRPLFALPLPKEKGDAKK